MSQATGTQFNEVIIGINWFKFAVPIEPEDEVMGCTESTQEWSLPKGELWVVPFGAMISPTVRGLKVGKL